MFSWAQKQLANVAGTREPIYGPSAIQSVAEQAKTTPYTELQRENLKWINMDSTSVETEVFYLFADSGHVGIAQVIHSNVIGIRTTSQFNCKIFYPGEAKPNLWSTDNLKEVEFSEDRNNYYAEGVAIELSADNKQYTVKSTTNENSLVNITITKEAPGFHVGVDGKSYYGTDPQAPWGSMRHAFWPRNKCEGTIVTKDGPIDFKGKALFIQALQGMKPHHAAAKWNFAYYIGEHYSAVMMQFATPPSYGSSIVNVGGLIKDDEIICAGSSNTVEHTKIKADDQNDWPEPEEVKLTWTGTTKDGKAVEAIVEGNLGKRLDKVDVMAEVPGFVKQLVAGAVGTKPYIYQYAPQDKLTLKLKIGDKEVAEDGILFAESTFICD